MTSSSAQTLKFPQIDKKFEEDVKNSLDDLYPTTSKRILQQRSDELKNVIDLYRGFKYQAISRESEFEADMFFLMQCTLSSIQSAYTTLKLFKEEDNVSSWHSLIDAYDFINISIKIAESYSDHLSTEEKIELKNTHGLYIIKQKLEAFESSIFRPQKIYNSPGLVETIGNCSICGELFHECDHVEGDIFMGKLCRRTNREIIRADHAAIVENPKDRRCIFTTAFNNERVSIDFFSREPLQDPKDENTYEGILQIFGNIDID